MPAHPLAKAIVDLVTILLIGLMVGSELSVAAFIHPILNRLEPRPQLTAAKPIAATLGRVMPPWYGLCLAALLLELWLHRFSPAAFDLLLVASVLWAVTIALSISALVPRNTRIASLDPRSPYLGWQKDRREWDRLHRIRVALLTVAFALLVAAVLPIF